MVYVDGIVEGYFVNKTNIDIDVAKIIVEQRKKLSNFEYTCILVDARNVTGVNKQARDFLGSKESYHLLNAAAIITGSSLSVFLSNFFLKVNLKRSNVPIRLFTDKDKARNWLIK
ncbi:MAG: hypothetical protein KDK36_04640, partial [Leptospiraceae bacterium]|nr:hypothetical protein [Leptospiraceae bacterium]